MKIEDYGKYRSRYMYLVHQGDFKGAQIDALGEVLDVIHRELRQLREDNPGHHEHLLKDQGEQLDRNFSGDDDDDAGPHTAA